MTQSPFFAQNININSKRRHNLRRNMQQSYLRMSSFRETERLTVNQARAISNKNTLCCERTVSNQISPVDPHFTGIYI